MTYIVETLKDGPLDVSLMPCGCPVQLNHFIQFIRPADREAIQNLGPRQRCEAMFIPTETHQGVKVEVYKCPNDIR